MTNLRALLLAGAIAGALSAASAAPALASPPEAPEITVESVKANEATLHGVLNPGNAGEAGEYQFLYKASETKECKGGGEAPTPPGLSAGLQHEEPSETLSKLAPNTEYAVCLREENAKGESSISPAASFKTAEATAPIIESQSSGPKTGTATVSAAINPGGAETTCEVKYGKTAALEAVPVPCPTPLPAGDAEQTVSVDLTGLEPKTEYHFEFVATNETGTTPAAAQATFKTGPHPPAFVVTYGPSEVKRARATLGEPNLGGEVLPSEGEETFYYFEYGSQACGPVTETCGVKTPARGPVTGYTVIEPQKLTRLKPGTTYHYWLVASSAGGTTHGEEMSFTTATAEPEEYIIDKTIEVSSPSGVGVNQTNGDLYVANETLHSIEQFNASGELRSSTKIPGASNGAVFQLAIDDSGIPGQQGDVYAADTADNVVYKFSPTSEGKLELDAATPEIGKGSLNEPRGVAVDASGNVYVASTREGKCGPVSSYLANGQLINPEVITGANSPTGAAVGLAVDANNDNIYLVCQGGTAEYTPTGTCAEPEPVTPPEPEKCKLINSELDESATLSAAGDLFVSIVSPATIVHEYGASQGHSPIQNPVLEQEQTFSSFPRGLAINDTNNTLDVAVNDGVEVFRYLQAKPVVVNTESATQVSGPVETLNGNVTPGGQEPAEYWFEYGTAPCGEESCGTVVREQGATPLYGGEALPVSVGLEGLAPDTTYHYRVVGANEESGVEYGNEETFTTGPEPSGRPAKSETETRNPAPGKGTSGVEYPNLSSLAPIAGPQETGNKGTSKPLSRAQKLQRALKGCRKVKKKKKRKECEALAKKAFGPKHKHKPKPKTKKQP